MFHVFFTPFLDIQEQNTYFYIAVWAIIVYIH